MTIIICISNTLKRNCYSFSEKKLKFDTFLYTVPYDLPIGRKSDY